MTERTWALFGHVHNDRIVDVETDRRVAALYGGVTVTVTAVEDYDGDYRGWIDTGTDVPVMVEHKDLFPMQFPYGVGAAVMNGEGVVVRLRLEVAP